MIITSQDDEEGHLRRTKSRW